MIRYRPQRGNLRDAMKECVILPDRTALEIHVRKTAQVATLGAFEIKPYGTKDGMPDPRIGWRHTFLVTLGGSPVGFCDNEK